MSADPDWSKHPWDYRATCPRCGASAAQSPHHRALVRAWASATGPKTPEGKAKVAKNLEGHPTPEETERTRFNALKHGLTAKVAQYFPARPGNYPACSACDVSWDYCASQPACVQQTQLFMLTHAAFEQKDPKHLNGIFANMQAGLLALMQQMLQTVLADGVKLTTPAWAVDREGNCVLAEYTDDAGQRQRIMDVREHPLIKAISQLLTRNNLNLADLGMTPKVQEEQEQRLGKLVIDDGNTGLLLSDFSQKQAKSLDALRALMLKARERKDADPVLIEYRQQNGDGDNADERVIDVG